MYYIYAYLRENGTPYYVGKGKGSRAWSNHRKIPVPSDNKRIIIMEDNLTEIGALALERRYIEWYGKKTNGGLLINISDGGDGLAGPRHSKEWKEKLSKRNTDPDFIEKRSKNWIIIYPNGSTEKIKNLKKFCRDYNLNYTTMQFVARGLYGCNQHKGFSIIKI